MCGSQWEVWRRSRGDFRWWNRLCSVASWTWSFAAKPRPLPRVDAAPRGQNAFKVSLLQRVVQRGLEETGGLA